jgi:polyisoprenoid-binding protein YceI
VLKVCKTGDVRTVVLDCTHTVKYKQQDQNRREFRRVEATLSIFRKNFQFGQLSSSVIINTFEIFLLIQ